MLRSICSKARAAKKLNQRQVLGKLARRTCVFVCVTKKASHF
jgi:hypothetical protein